MALIIIIGVVVLGVVLLKPYFQRFDNLVLYTGTLGSGKTFNAVKTSLRLLKRNRIKVAFYNAMPWHKEKLSRPLLYSNVPVLVSKRRKEFSARLKAEHFTMSEAIIPRSVVLIDEVSLVLSQMDYKTVNDQALAESFHFIVSTLEGVTLSPRLSPSLSVSTLYAVALIALIACRIFALSWACSMSFKSATLIYVRTQ